MVTIPEAPWRNLAPKPIAFRERGGVLIQDPEAFPPVLAAEVVPQDVPCTQGPREDRKGAGALRCALWKTEVKDLRYVFHLNGQQTVPLNLQLCPMHTSSVHRHQYHGKFYSTVQTGDTLSHPL